jgi:peptidyl-dipeptidase A
MFSTIRNNQEGMKYMMHLCGHTSHYKNISEDIPYLLKDPNTVVSEGVATFFENLSLDYIWLKSEFPMDSANSKKFDLICRHFFQVDRLFRCRKLLVFSEFEREIYRDPEQNLGELWYQLNLKYLGIHPPDEKSTADWAASKYAANFPCNIHNYILADLFAAQLQHTLEKGILHEGKSQYQNNKAIGNFLVSRLYRYGDLLPWEKLIEKVTGEPLNPVYFTNYLLGESDRGR